MSGAHGPAVADVPEGRFSEGAFVFPVELGHALITDGKGCAGNTLVFQQHKPPCFVEAHLFLILERAQPRHLLKAAVEVRR